jgi:hypothetical protein
LPTGDYDVLISVVFSYSATANALNHFTSRNPITLTGSNPQINGI